MNSKWIIATPVSAHTSLYIFRKRFDLQKKAKSFSVRISADTAYRLFINGKECAQGPCIGSFFYKHFEDVDCTAQAVIGENEIEAEVLYAGGTMGMNGIKRKRAVAFSLVGERDGEIFQSIE